MTTPINLRSHPARFEIHTLALELMRQHSGPSILTMREAVEEAARIVASEAS